jgi:hypothetical protein
VTFELTFVGVGVEASIGVIHLHMRFACVHSLTSATVYGVSSTLKAVLIDLLKAAITLSVKYVSCQRKALADEAELEAGEVRYDGSHLDMSEDDGGFADDVADGEGDEEEEGEEDLEDDGDDDGYDEGNEMAEGLVGLDVEYFPDLTDQLPDDPTRVLQQLLTAVQQMGHTPAMLMELVGLARWQQLSGIFPAPAAP